MNDKPAHPNFEAFERYNEATGNYEEYHFPVGGMTLKEYYIGQALNGLLAGLSAKIFDNSISSLDFEGQLSEDLPSMAINIADRTLEKMEDSNS